MLPKSPVRFLGLWMLTIFVSIGLAHASREPSSLGGSSSSSKPSSLLPEGGMCGLGGPQGEMGGVPGCMPSEALDERKATTGWALYSWKEKGIWNYALLPARKASVSARDLRSVRVEGRAALLSRLESIQRGGDVFWNAGPVEGLSTELPPSRDRGDIQAFCRRKHVRLHLR